MRVVVLDFREGGLYVVFSFNTSSRFSLHPGFRTCSCFFQEPQQLLDALWVAEKMQEASGAAIYREVFAARVSVKGAFQ